MHSWGWQEWRQWSRGGIEVAGGFGYDGLGRCGGAGGGASQEVGPGGAGFTPGDYLHPLLIGSGTGWKGGWGMRMMGRMARSGHGMALRVTTEKGKRAGGVQLGALGRAMVGPLGLSPRAAALKAQDDYDSAVSWTGDPGAHQSGAKLCSRAGICKQKG